MRDFLDRVHDDDLAGATVYLSLSKAGERRASERARRLAVVLDRAGSLDLASLSDEAEGDLDDELVAHIEEVGVLAQGDGATTPIRMERYFAGDRQLWRFTAGTVGRIDAWYEAIEVGLLASWMPAALRTMGPYGVEWWQWIAVVVVIVLGLALGRLLGRLSEAICSRLASRTSTSIDDEVIHAGAPPLTAFWSLLLMQLALPAIGLHAQAATFASDAISVGMFAVVFWAMMRGVHVAAILASRTAWALRSPSSRSLIPLARRTLKAIVFVIGVVSMLSNLGYPVASLIAGLGVGGIAIALAAQKTVENLFGAFSLGVDQPIREGDFVKVEDFVGTVEEVGLRSTRIRTLDRTLVTIPNGRLADMRLESFAVRDRLRLACKLGVLYSTAPEKLDLIVGELRSTLRRHPKIWPDSVNVHVADFGESSVNIDVMCWFQTTQWDEFLQIRHDTYLEFMRIVHAAGSDFAFPTRTLEFSASFTQALLASVDRVDGAPADWRKPLAPS
jgi:MscS family membrane protein